MASMLFERGSNTEFAENSVVSNSPQLDFENSLQLAITFEDSLDLIQERRPLMFPTSASRRENSNSAGNVDAIIKAVTDIPISKIQEVYKKHYTAISSVNLVTSFPVYFITFCVIEMEKNSEVIGGQSLLNKCENLKAGSPHDFISKLKEKLHDHGLLDVEVSKTLGMSPTGHGSGDAFAAFFVSPNMVNSNVPPEHESVVSDDVDGSSSNSGGSGGLHDSRFSLSSMGASIGDYNFTEALPSSSDDPGGKKEKCKPASHGEGKDVESTKRKTEARLQEALFAVMNENKLLEDCRVCVKCHERPRGVTFLPCGHFNMCRECAGPTYVCSSCQKNVLATVDTFLS